MAEPARLEGVGSFEGDEGDMTVSPFEWSFLPAGSLTLSPEDGLRAVTSDPVLPLPPGAAWEPVLAGECPTTACPLGVQVPADGAGQELFPREARSPYPAGDRWDRGMEDWYLVEFLMDEPRNESSLVALDGADGSPVGVHEYAADWVVPANPFDTAERAVEVLLVLEERFVFFESGSEFWLWSGFLVGVDPVTLEERWRVDLDAHVDEGGAGFVEVAAVFQVGPYTGSGSQALFHHARFSWEESVWHADFEVLALGIVDLSDLSLLTPIPNEDLRSLTGWPTPDGWDVLVTRTDGSLERFSGRDGELLWTLSSDASGLDALWAHPVQAEGEAAALVSATDGSDWLLARLDLDGSFAWARQAPSFWFTDAGVGPDETTRITFLEGSYDCMAEVIDYRFEQWELAAGETVWSAQGALDVPFPSRAFLSPAGGDVTGDGLGDPVAFRLTTHYDALFQDVDPCGGSGSWFLILDSWQEGETLYYSSADGSVAFHLGPPEHPEATLVPPWRADVRVTALPYMEWGTSGASQFVIQVHSVDVASGAVVTGDAVNVLFLNPAWTTRYLVLWILPGGFWSDSHDHLALWWWGHDRFQPIPATEPVIYERYQLARHMVPESARAWAYSSDMPWDVDLVGFP